MRLLTIGSATAGIVVGWLVLRPLLGTFSKWRRAGTIVTLCGFGALPALYSLIVAVATSSGIVIGIWTHQLFLSTLRRISTSPT